MTTATELPNGLAHQHDFAKPSTSAPASFLPRTTAPLTDAQTNTTGDSLPNLGELDVKCGGCTKVIDQENGGVVVAFGTSLWHVDCFRCAKCQERVSADTNLLLLSDGSPVCGKCSYNCYVCKQSITEEAIMTGDESYHAHCFTCRTCKRRIEELVFAKTSQGIYCMACHNDRVARSRRHAEARRQRAARKDREREEEDAQRRDKENQEEARARTAATLNGTHSSSSTSLLTSSVPAHSVTAPSPAISPTATPMSEASARFAEPPMSEDETRSRELSVERPVARSTTPITHTAELSMPVTPSESGRLSSERSPQPLQHRSPSPVPPLRVGSPARNGNPGLGVGPVSMSSGLGVPVLSKAEKRRSINPAMTFNMDAANSTFAAEPRLSPLPPSPLRASFTDQAQKPTRQGHQLSPTSPTSTKSMRPPNESMLQRQPSDEQPYSPPPALPPKQPSTDSISHQEKLATPQLNTPNLPHMSFSLSDPDFALILNGIDQSPEKETKTASSGTTIRPPLDHDDENSPPAVRLDSPLGRSPPVLDTLSAASEQGPSKTPPRHQLSPNSGAGSTPLLLRTRQPSAESTMSLSRLDGDSSFASIVEMVASAKHNQQDTVQVDLSLLSGIVGEVEDLKEALVALKSKYTGAKRTSQQYSEGLTVAGEEYDKEVAHRRDLEAEVSRLRAQVHTQTARLSVISGDERRQENMRRRSNDLAVSLTGLEKDISRLRAQRDMSLAEVEELRNNSRNADSTGEDAAEALSQSLTNRLDTIKEQYREELEPLTAQREALQREIAELRETREQFLEESAALAAKNEELAELNAQLSRQAEQLQDSLSRNRGPTIFNRVRTHPSGSPSLSSLATSTTLHEVPEETARVVKVTKPEPIEAAPARRFKWYKSSKGPDMSSVSASISKPLNLPPNRNIQRPSTEMGLRDHQFQQHSTMRFTRCELCQEKMWGLQEVRCASCGMVCHAKCAEKLPKSCSGSRAGPQEMLDGPMPPSMFGRDLTEQIFADKLPVPAIVTKCIAAVEVVGMEYEGIYRKTGGSSQSKQITLLFERGDYDSFDLADLEAFNDISSTTSVLKTYFRQLPDPLLTHALHESFVAAASIRDAGNKHSALCALLKELPKDNYNTLRLLMLHLNRVAQLASVNLMTSQNLGVVFGPTLMRSSDPGREFGDMAGKALSVQWMVDNAPQVFTDPQL